MKPIAESRHATALDAATRLLRQFFPTSNFFLVVVDPPSVCQLGRPSEINIAFQTTLPMPATAKAARAIATTIEATPTSGPANG